MDIQTTIKNDLSWLQKHERIVLITLALAVTLFLGNKWLDYNANKWENRAIVAEQNAKQQEELVKTLTQQTADAKAQYQQIIDTLEKQNVALASAVAARNVVLQQQQQAIQTAPPDEVAKTVQSLAKLNSGDLTVQGSNTIVTQFGMRQIASELLRIPVLEANVTDISAIADNRQKELDKANNVIGAQNTQITGLTDLIEKNKIACEAEVKKTKAEARKSKRNWFLGGLLTGLGLGVKIASMIM